MARPRTPNLEKLLKFMQKRGSLTHKQMAKFLLAHAGLKYDDTTRKYFDPALYGRGNTDGVLVRFCQKNTDGTWSVRKGMKIEGPYTYSYPSLGEQVKFGIHLYSN